MLTKIAILAIIIFFGFRALQFIHRLMPLKKAFKYHTRYILPIIELFVWISLLVWGVSHLYEAEKYNTLAFLGIIFLLSAIPLFILLRNFLIGVSLRIQRRVNVGNGLTIDNMQGTIEKVGNFSIEVNAEGKLQTIPYSKINAIITTHSSNNPHLKKRRLQLTVPASVSREKVIATIKKAILFLPWASQYQTSLVESCVKDGNEFIVELSVFVIDDEHVANIREGLMVQLHQEFA